MSWINEVEMAKSKEDLLTSQSIERRRDFPDFEIFDARIASALRKIINTTNKSQHHNPHWLDKILLATIPLTRFIKALSGAFIRTLLTRLLF